MSSTSSHRHPGRAVGIVAGGGELPREIAESLAARGVATHIVAVEGEADGDLTGFPVTRLGWGEVGRMLATFRAADVRDVVLVGKVKRPDLKRLRPDLGFLVALPEIAALIARGGGDDRVLRGIIRFMERRGFRIVGVDQVAPQLVVGRGLIGRAHPSTADVADMGLAAALLAALAPFDIGQGAIARAGRIEAVEAAENTDAMLERVAARRRAEGRMQRGGVLVKLTKRGQERRIDLPAIGARTVIGAAAAGLAGIGVEAGGVVAVRRDDLVARADGAGLFVAGIDPVTDGAPPTRERRRAGADIWRLRGAQVADRRLASDASLGADVQAAAAPFEVGRAVVVARGHVLGLEAGEDVATLLARVAGLRQWGLERSRKRAGVLVLADAAALTSAIIEAADRAGLAAVALTAASSPLAMDRTTLPILVRDPQTKEQAR